MTLKYNWTFVAKDVYRTAVDCGQSGRTTTVTEPHSHVIIFPLAGPLQFIAVGIFGRLSQMKNGNRFLFNITDC